MSAPVVALTSSTLGAIISPSFFSPVVTSTPRRAGGTRRRDRRARPGVVPERSAAASAAAITAHAIWQPFGETRSGPARSGGRQSAAPCARTRASRSLWQSEPGSSTSLPYRKFRSVTASPPAGGLWENVTFVSSVTASFPSIRFCSTAHGYSLHFPAHQRAVQRILEILQAWRDQTRRAWATTRVK